MGTSFARDDRLWVKNCLLFVSFLPRSVMLQRLWGRSRLPICARYVREQPFAVCRNIIAAPGDMLIGTDQREPSFVSLVQSRIRRGQYFERYFALRGGPSEAVGRACVALGD